MTVDAIRLASSVDAVIIVSGDGDFIPLVEYLKFNSGCQVEVATFKSTASAGLIEVVDDFFDLSDDLDRYLMRKYRNNFKGYRKNYFPNNQKNNSNLIKKDKVNSDYNIEGENTFVQEIKNKNDFNGEKKLEAETPEMISERVSQKRSIPVKNKIFRKINKKDSVVADKLRATEVQISRIKKTDLIISAKEKSNNIVKKGLTEKKNNKINGKFKKIKKIIVKKKEDKKNKKVVKKIIKRVVKK
jgi:hypothetical protein